MSVKGGEKPLIQESIGTENAQTVTETDVFDVLKNERRRAVIRYLDDHGGSAKLSDVAEKIAADENETTVQRLTSKERKRVRIALYQCHLPRMDTIGVVEFDKHRGTIELRDPAARVLMYLNTEPEASQSADSSDRLVFAFSVGVAALAIAGALGLGMLSAVPPSGWTVVSALALVGLAGEEWLRG